MVAGFLIILLNAFRKKNREEKEEREEPPTVRQSLIKIIALIITAFLGLFLLGIMDQVMEWFLTP